ncbi:hypothetical protein [Actinoplanes subtropicus]|uniref:hypothetical protein n=1 Tax=Actinoplanes subtropicus TaxID=543632 RepID=UPI0004C38988|nr:hypothetical protein [Actinoplanes subtropicus]
MLDVDQALVTMAQIGVALPGFAGVITSLRHRGNAELLPPEIRGLLLMLTLASIVVIGGIAPFVIVTAVGERQTWRICGVCLGLMLAGVAGYNAWIAHRDRDTPWAPRRPRVLRWSFVVPGLVVAFTQLLGAFWPSPGLYLAGLLLVLVGGGRQFMLLLVLAPMHERPAAAGQEGVSTLPDE